MIDTPAPRTLRRHQTITLSLLFLAGVVNFLDRTSLSIANTTVRAEMHLSATQMGWLLSAFSLAYGIAQLPLIGLLDRARTGVVRTFPLFIFLRILLGAGEAPFYPSGIRSTREWFSSATRARATAIMSSSQTIGLAVAPPILTAIMLALGWRAMFVVLGASGLLVAILWIALHRPRSQTPFAEPPTTDSGSKIVFVKGTGLPVPYDPQELNPALAAEVASTPSTESTLRTLIH